MKLRYGKNMENYADRLSDPIRKRFRLYAYISSWFGCFADVMLESTAVIILYFSVLGAGNTLIMFSTSIPGLVSLFLLIPVSGLVDKIGAKKTVCLSCSLACFSYLLMASAPFFGTKCDQYVVLTGCLLFCLSKPL